MNTIEQLKKLVVQAEDTKEPLNYFFDMIDANMFDEIKNHRPVENINQHPELMAIMEIVKKSIHQKIDRPTKQLVPVFHEVPEKYFYHGMCLSVDSCMPIVIIYFSDVKIGIVAHTEKQTDMIRFSLMRYTDFNTVH